MPLKQPTSLTPAQLDLVISRLQSFLEFYGVAAKRFPRTKRMSGDIYEIASHCLWMVEELRSNKRTRSDEPKFQRWLGTIYGMLIASGQLSTEDAAKYTFDALRGLQQIDATEAANRY